MRTRDAMSCKQARESLSAGYDGELGSTRNRWLEAHLRRCEDCRRAAAEYRESLDRFSASLRAMVDGELPHRPFPAAPRRSWNPLGSHWAPRMAFAMTAVAAVFVASYAPQPVAVVPAPVSVAVTPQADDCPWRPAEVQELPEAVSFPVTAQDCLDESFELIEARVRDGAECGEDVQLTYRAGTRRLVVEQQPQTHPGSCPGERVLMGDIGGCFERLARGMALRWSHDSQVFRLEGELETAEALQVARTISFGH